MKRFLLYISTFLSVGLACAQETKIDFITPSIVRVRICADGQFKSNETGVCIYQNSTVKVTSKETDNSLTLYSSDLTVVYDKEKKSVQFLDEDQQNILMQYGQDMLIEPVYQEHVTYDDKSARVEETANGKVTTRDVIRRDTIGRSTRYRVGFMDYQGRALYGLGCQMEDYMNLAGKTVWLTQHNLKVHIPVIVSPDGFGLLFDAGCAMKFEGNADKKHFTMQLEAAKTLDYYFIRGEKMENIVAGYHYLTGKVSLLPRYAFGYTQSKERYVSSDDILKTLKEYRRRHVPIDMIVQDWNYWPQGWGYMKMDPKYYPDPKALADSVHAMNAKLMVSIWPNPQWCPEADDFKSKGMMLQHDVYDVFNPKARELYWKYANDEFFSKGFDAWWCDSSEPLDGDWNSTPAPEGGVPYGWNSQERRWNLNKQVLSEALGAERSSLYSLYHSMGIYENQHSCTPPSGVGGLRVLNLTRSSYAGQQRYGTIVWNGDTHASWQSFRDQIPAGLNYMATGNPYWTVDVGSFFTRDDGRRWFYKGEFQDGVKSDAYKEYYVRMFQWGTFLPMLRSHGSDTPREIWQFEDGEAPLQSSTTSPEGEEGHPDETANGKSPNSKSPNSKSIVNSKSPNSKSQNSKSIVNSKYVNSKSPNSKSPNSKSIVNSKYVNSKYYDAILKMINLRYAHVPYIYSMAAAQTFNDYTMARMLAFDFANDSTVLDIKDEYMFGDYLVCPVTHPMSEETVHKVYLPKGTSWTNYWTGTEHEGGRWIVQKNEIDKFPLFVKAGSIITTTQVAEYTDAQLGKPITINVYPGADCEFTLYEDAGNDWNYERGQYSMIPMKWNEKKHTLTIDRQTGSFPGMQTSHTFIIRTKGDSKTITYNGKKTTIKL